MAVPLQPTLNAGLNALALLCLVAGYGAIRGRGDRHLHLRFMLSALAISTLFLVSYVVYHAQHGSTPYPGQGPVRILYFAVLLTHIPLAAAVVPLSLVAVGFALKQRFDLHVRVVRWLWPVWVYVSATGVLIYLMLYVL